MAELVNEFAWSVSRARTFKECKRQYYYDVYGFWNGWRDDAPEETKELYVLHQLKTRWMWAGEVVHNAIQRYLEELKREHPVESGAWRADTVQRMRADWANSRRKLYREPGMAKRSLALFEHEYDVEVAQEKWRDLSGMVEDCLMAFEDTKALENLRRVPSSDWTIEEFVKIPLREPEGGGSVLMLAKMDFVYRTRERHLRIIDWKTGKGESRGGGADANDDLSDTALQMGAYGLAAVEKWKTAPDAVEAFAINLRTRAEAPYPVGPQEVERARARLFDDAKEMRSFLRDPGSNLAIEDDYPGAADPDICRWCGFRRLCPVRPA
ncbi:MAG: PD-(D/E)XK nuclease family protein [Nitrospirae bacterium]|nr:PD-(D/E)XK nuclease family protein [Nitrospirota bacterium]